MRPARTWAWAPTRKSGTSSSRLPPRRRYSRQRSPALWRSWDLLALSRGGVPRHRDLDHARGTAHGHALPRGPSRRRASSGLRAPPASVNVPAGLPSTTQLRLASSSGASHPEAEWHMGQAATPAAVSRTTMQRPKPEPNRAARLAAAAVGGGWWGLGQGAKPYVVLVDYVYLLLRD